MLAVCVLAMCVCVCAASVEHSRRAVIYGTGMEHGMSGAPNDRKMQTGHFDNQNK